MKTTRILATCACLATSASWGAATAQETAAPPPSGAPVAVEVAPQQPLNEDEMADYLNAQQQIKQDVTLTRTVNGKVVETRKETITYSNDDPIRSTEAAQSALQKLKADFDNASLTRKEAYDEARLDFILADLDRDDAMTVDEFAHLVETWRQPQGETALPSGEISRERFVEFLELQDPAAAKAESEAQARAKFQFMAGPAGVLTRKNYIREVLTDFDAFDLDDDGMLRGEELLRFRAANRGEPLGS